MVNRGHTDRTQQTMLNMPTSHISSLRMRSQRSTRPGAGYRKRFNGAAARLPSSQTPAQTGLGLRRISTGRQQASSANYSDRPNPVIGGADLIAQEQPLAA